MIPPLSIGKGLIKDPKQQAVANAIAAQNGLYKTSEGNNPAVDYIVKKQVEASNSKKAKPNG